MIIGIDHGYYAMKTKNFSFPSGVIRYEHEPYTDKDVLQIDGEYYVCGTGRQPLQKNKTLTDSYYILTLVAIARELVFRKAPKKAEILIAAGLPLTSFGRDKNDFRKYLMDRKNPVIFEFEKESYEITISDVKLFPQGYSALAMRSDLIKDEPSVVLVDVGGWTIDIMRLDNGVPNAATCRSIEMGVIKCHDEILEQVRRNTGLSITDAQVERVLNGQSCSMDESIRKIILRYAEQYSQKVLSVIMEAGFDLRAIPSVFIGGGAEIIQSNLKRSDDLCKITALSDIHLNATGYERIANLMLKQ